MSNQNPQPADILGYVHMLIGDGRISFVNVALSSDRLKSSVEFQQKHFMNIDVESNYNGVPVAIREVTKQHPTRMFISQPSYTVKLNRENHYAYIQGVLALKKYLTKTRIPWDLATAMLNSPVFNVETKEDGDGYETYDLDFKPDEEN